MAPHGPQGATWTEAQVMICQPRPEPATPCPPAHPRLPLILVPRLSDTRKSVCCSCGWEAGATGQGRGWGDMTQARARGGGGEVHLGNFLGGNWVTKPLSLRHIAFLDVPSPPAGPGAENVVSSPGARGHHSPTCTRKGLQSSMRLPDGEDDEVSVGASK